MKRPTPELTCPFCGSRKVSPGTDSLTHEDFYFCQDCHEDWDEQQQVKAEINPAEKAEVLP